MFRARTISEQILPVLGAIRRNVGNGVPIPDACQVAIRAGAKQTGLTYQTIVDGLRRRLGLDDISEFHRLVESWIARDTNDLKHLLLDSSDTAAQELIEEFFGKPDESSYLAPRDPAGPTGLAERRIEREPPPNSIMIDRLDPYVLAVLQDRARRNQRSLNDEIRAILVSTARRNREELAGWAIKLRERLLGDYQGDSTAEIRSDRER